MTISSRLYQPQDRIGCLAVFDGNTPRYFAPEERAEFEVFLDTDTEESGYSVLLSEDTIVGCGGLTRKGDEAFFVWGMVRRDLHRQGLGTALTEARLTQARAMEGLARVTLSTSQRTAPFYARFGFVTIAETPEGYGPGIDRIDMVLAL